MVFKLLMSGCAIIAVLILWQRTTKVAYDSSNFCFSYLKRRQMSRYPSCKRTGPFPWFRRNLVVQHGPDEAAAHESEEDLQAEDELHHAGARHDAADDRPRRQRRVWKQQRCSLWCIWVRRSVTDSENITGGVADHVTSVAVAVAAGNGK